MKRIRLPGSLFIVGSLALIGGCRNASVDFQFTSGGETQTQSGDDVSTDVQAAAADEEPDVVVTLADLKEELKRHKDDSGWHMGPRPDGAPIGSWQSEDADPIPLVFAEDGTFQCGFGWKSKPPKIAKGFYAISEDGLIVAVASHKSARLGVFYRLEDDGKIYGSRGPSPRVAWRMLSKQTQSPAP